MRQELGPVVHNDQAHSACHVLGPVPGTIYIVSHLILQTAWRNWDSNTLSLPSHPAACYVEAREELCTACCCGSTGRGPAYFWGVGRQSRGDIWGIPGSWSAWTEAQETGASAVHSGKHASFDGLHPVSLHVPKMIHGAHTVDTPWP